MKLPSRLATPQGARIAIGRFPMSDALLTLQMPQSPNPVPVVLDAATTALLVFDIVDPICTRQPNCTEKMVPAIASLLAKARKAGVTVAYGTRAPTMSKWLLEASSWLPPQLLPLSVQAE